VWEARDRQTGEIVAVKVIQPLLLTSPGAERRFLREVASARSLDHPHTVRVLAHGRTSEGSGYLVMERLVGSTLSSRLAEAGPLEQRRAIKIVAQILDAAATAHRLQIVHRDLKPSNVMLVERDGDPEFVKVCDFGLAKAIDVDQVVPEASGQGVLWGIAPPATEVGEICGTPAYMAPEQARGEELDGRVDIYSVGVLLFEALVGRVPFLGRSTLAVVSQHLSAAPPRPSALRPELQIFPPLESLVLRALAKNPAERPSSAEVFRADLLQIDRDLLRTTRRGSRVRPQVSSHDAPTLPRAHEPAPASRRTIARLAIAGTVAVCGAIGLRAIWPGGPSVEPSREVASAVGPDMVSSRRARLDEPRARPISSASSAATVSEPLPLELHDRIAQQRGDTPPARQRVRSGAGLTRRGEAAGRPSRPATVPAPEPVTDARADADRLVARAEVLLGQGRIAEACGLGRAATEVAPGAAAAWELLGRCQMRLGRPVDARAAYRRYLALAPDGPDAVFVRAIVNREPK
jgi:serine/threonine-protein kinase